MLQMAIVSRSFQLVSNARAVRRFSIMDLKPQETQRERDPQNLGKEEINQSIEGDGHHGGGQEPDLQPPHDDEDDQGPNEEEPHPLYQKDIREDPGQDDHGVDEA